MAPGIAGKDVPVPDFQLDDSSPLAHPLPQQQPPQGPSDGEGNGIPDTEHPAIEYATPAGPEVLDRTAIVAGQEDSVGEVPDFGEQANRPVSMKVSMAFHHRARNKSAACPACGEFALYRSRTRSLGENLRKKLTSKRPYRCHRCGWRGWMKK